MAIDKPAQFTIDGTLEERTRRVVIDCPRGKPYSITADREVLKLDSLGNALAPPVAVAPVIRTIDGSDIEAVRIATDVANKIDLWAQGK